MKYFLTILFFFLYFLSFSQVIFEEWYTIYDSNDLKVDVQFFLPLEGEECQANTKTYYAYRYNGKKEFTEKYVKWSLNIASCSDITYKLTACAPIGGYLLDGFPEVIENRSLEMETPKPNEFFQYMEIVSD
ncbi:MAG: hypothetical protein P8I93_09725, partial [Crocinitomicaceae bacterium]|nr:hypothetical protein [Crocinitomicaceae bacterium]